MPQKPKYENGKHERLLQTDAINSVTFSEAEQENFNGKF